MGTQLKLDYVDGLRLRHQMAHTVERLSQDKGGDVQGGTEWRFAEDVPRDIDPRKRDSNGAPMILNTLTFYISYGLKNVVVEKKGKPENLTFRNTSLRNSLRIKQQAFTNSGKVDKNEQPIKKWMDQSTMYLPANTWGGVFVGDGNRAIVDEMPT